MQVTTSNQDTPQGTRTSKAQGSRYAGNHFQPGHTTRHTNQQAQGSKHAGNHTNQAHEPARHEVQGMQVTTSNQDTPQGTRTSRHKVQGMQVTTPTRHEPGIQGSRHAGNHFQPGHTTRHEDTRTRDTRFKVCR